MVVGNGSDSGSGSGRVSAILREVLQGNSPSPSPSLACN